MPDTQLNPDALEAAASVLCDETAGQHTRYADLKTGLVKKLWGQRAEHVVSAYLAVAQPEVLANSKPNQNLEFAQPEVSSVEELDALPEGTILRDSYGLALHKRTANWWVTNGDNNLTSEDLADEIADTAHTYTVLYRPEATDGR